MAKFTTRVELHDAKSPEDYTGLHEYMEEEGFSRRIRFGQVRYELPTAEYNYTDEDTIESVLEAAKRAATKTGKKFSVLVTETTVARAHYNLKEAPKFKKAG